MLEIKQLSVQIDKKDLFKKLSFSIKPGETSFILGKNGSGKSSLAHIIMGNPEYKIFSGDILWQGKSISKLGADQRSKLGIYFAFQHIPEIPGIKVFEFLRILYNLRHEKNLSFLQFKLIIMPFFDELHIDHEFLWRDLFVGFSGGEKRKIELIQIKLLEPKLIILDEIDSGLDFKSLNEVGKRVAEMQSPDRSFLIISHQKAFLEHFKFSKLYHLEAGKLEFMGDQKKLDAFYSQYSK